MLSYSQVWYPNWKLSWVGINFACKQAILKLSGKLKQSLPSYSNFAKENLKESFPSRTGKDMQEQLSWEQK